MVPLCLQWFEWNTYFWLIVQILLCYDLLGVFTDFKPKFTKRFSNVTEVAVKGIKEYAGEVRNKTFPDDDHTYGVDDKEYEKFLTMIEKRKHT